MTKQTVMEMADAIMSKMGISDTVPLSEVTTDSLHSVGKNYGGELPEISDKQREKMLMESGVITETAPKQREVIVEDSVPVKKRMLVEKKPTNIETASKLLGKVINRQKNNWSPQATIGQSLTSQGQIANIAKLIGQSETDEEATVKKEMTSVGAIGIGPFGNKPAADPLNPKKKKQRKTLRNFISKSFTY